MLENRKMTIALDKILTISARDYCDMHGKSLTDYEAVGVHVKQPYDLINRFVKAVPDEAEVIIGFNHSAAGGSVSCRPVLYASGTALIPRK